MTSSNTNQSYLYVIGSEDGPKKIGMSGNPDSRLAALQTASPVRLEGEFLGSVDLSAARSIEARAHKILSASRMSGEWFDVSLDDAVNAVFAAADDLGYSIEKAGSSSTESGISSVQCRMARAALKWTVTELGKKARVTPNTVSRFENQQGSKGAYVNTANALKAALESSGKITFNGNDCVCKDGEDDE